MTFGAAVKSGFAKYATFSGRAARSEYWWFFLFLLLGNMIAGILDFALFGSSVTTSTDTSVAIHAQSDGPFAAVFALATFIPHLALGWRRMHDSGRSGLYLFFPFLITLGVLTVLAIDAGMTSLLFGGTGPFYSSITGILALIAIFLMILSPFMVLYWLTRPSQPGTNDYGPNPAEVTT